MDDNNKKDYSDFFKRQSDKNQQEQAVQETTQAGKEEKSSYYYSYGPYKSAFQEPNPEQTTTSVSQSTGTSNVEVTPPHPVRPFGYHAEANPASPMGEWQFEKKKRSSMRSTFAAFMAGALVVGSLMFASDKMNLFTSSQPVFIGGSSQASPNVGSGSGGGNAKNTSLDLARPTTISQMVKNSSPAVVKVESLVKARSSSRSGGNSLFDDPFFRQFFGDDPSGNSQPKSKNNNNSGGDGPLQPAGMGTGFIFEKSGYILTNQHVVEGADEVQVTIQGNDKPFKAKLLGSSHDLDLAALKIEGDNFPILPLGNSDDASVGDWVVAIGNPYGFDHTVTVGVLSAKERPITIADNQGNREYKHLFQTDASINPGNSGGPLLNLNGEVIGINTAVSAQAQGIGFAIPTSTIASVLDNLKNNVKIPREPSPYIGVQVGDIPQEYVQELKLDNTDGALVADVPLGSPGFKAGIKTYDVILGINGNKVKNKDELIKKIQASKVGEKVTLNIVRDGKKTDVDVVVGDKNQDTKSKQSK